MIETLHIPIKKRWFDMIKSGIKKEEYREIKSHWLRRVLYKIQWKTFKNPLTAEHDILGGDFEGKAWKEFTGGAPLFESVKRIEFRNGYGKGVPYITVDCLGIEIKEGNPEWGAEPGKKYIVFKLGHVLYEN